MNFACSRLNFDKNAFYRCNLKIFNMIIWTFLIFKSSMSLIKHSQLFEYVCFNKFVTRCTSWKYWIRSFSLFGTSCFMRFFHMIHVVFQSFVCSWIDFSCDYMLTLLFKIFSKMSTIRFAYYFFFSWSFKKIIKASNFLNILFIICFVWSS